MAKVSTVQFLDLLIQVFDGGRGLDTSRLLQWAPPVVSGRRDEARAVQAQAA
jgi:hypothetical protein